MDGRFTAVLTRTARCLMGSLVWMCGVAAYGQVIELNGGASSLYQTEGGSIVLHGPAYEGEVGAGLIAGRLVAGGRVAYRQKDTVYSAGVEELRFDLPTDLFNSDHRLLGVGVDMKSTRPGNALELFAGGTSQRSDTPLFTGVRADQPAAALVLQHAFSPSVLTATHLLAANPGTALQAIQWTPARWLKLAAAGGFGGTSHYEAVSADLRRPLFDLKAAYIDAPPGFQRLGSDPTISPEPTHENLQFTVRSSARDPRLTLSGGRQNFLEPASAVTTPDGTALPDLISTSNQVSVSTRVKTFALTAAAIKSSYNGESNIAFVYTASAAPNRRVHLQTSYFQSRVSRQSSLLLSAAPSPKTNTVVTNVQETLTQRYSLNQTITYSNGQTSIGYGGSILSNVITLSADYETFYVPTRLSNPFQQSLVLDLELNLFGRIRLHGGTFLSPSGQVLYTANAYAVQGKSIASDVGGEHVHLGMYIVQGRVVDTNGDPLPGAAISVGTNLVFTDSAGEFFFRDKRPQTYPFRVLVDQFLDGHNYSVVSQPFQVPSIRAENQHLLIVVQRRADSPPPDLCPPAARPQRRQPATPFTHPPCDVPPSGASASKPSPKSSPSGRQGKAGSS